MITVTVDFRGSNTFELVDVFLRLKKKTGFTFFFLSVV